MVFWILCFFCTVIPLILVNVWSKTDKRGRYLSEKNVRSMELWVVVVIFFCLASCILACLAFFRDEIQDLGYLIGLFITGLILMIYPVTILRSTRLEGAHLDMWDHLKHRKEVIFPWEFRPTATLLAIVYYLCGLMAFSMAVYMLLILKELDGTLLQRGIVAAVLFVGVYICYLIFKQPKSQ